jgi:hypothetical protein
MDLAVLRGASWQRLCNPVDHEPAGDSVGLWSTDLAGLRSADPAEIIQACGLRLGRPEGWKLGGDCVGL